MWGGTDEANSIRAIHASLDAGVNFIDSAPAYGVGRAEQIVGKAIHDRRDRVVLATKCGLAWHTEKGRFHEIQWGRRVYRYLGPESIRYELEESLKRLQTDHIDLYQTHFQDETTPIEDTLGEFVRLKQEGKIRAIGLSNLSLAQLEKYHRLGPVDSDQEEYSMLNRDVEAELLPFCRAHNIALVAYSPLAQGLLCGNLSPERQFPEGDFRRDHPRFSVENRKKAAALVQALEAVARCHGASLAQLAIAWTISPGRATHVLVGARDVDQAVENARAGDLQLNEDELALINQEVDRYASGIPHLLWNTDRSIR
jgi:aryl-alcohol dehydrogenase-like predicted oxidoreductase